MIGGASCSFSLLKILADQYVSIAKDTKIESLEPGQSEAVIAGLKQNVIDVRSISNILKPEDKHSTLETHADATLDAREVAKDGLVVVTHSSVIGIKNLTTDNLKTISGKPLPGLDGVSRTLDDRHSQFWIFCDALSYSDCGP